MREIIPHPTHSKLLLHRYTYIHQGTEFPLDPVSDLRESDGPLPQPRLSHQFQSGCGQEAIPTHTRATGENIHKRLYSLMYIINDGLVIVLLNCITSVKIIKNEVGCRDDAVPKTVETRRHCEEE